MATHALLNNVEHKNIKIITERSAKYGDDQWFSPTFVAEFKTVQAHYPIMFQKNADTGEFTPVTLFGFKNNENLFLNEGKWDASYIPLSMQRLPFYIGTQHSVMNGVSEPQRVITLDMDSPRVNDEQGVELFLPFGGNSEYLENMANILEELHQGLNANALFVAALTHFDLLEAVTIDVTLNNDSQHQLIGFYTINEDKLASLAADKVIKLHQSGYLEAIYMIIASQAHMRKLVERKNSQLTH
ncbi:MULTISPECIES: SapC family protein [unclassified Shewanella]|uniref:SapC family protein n=1 Tax=unclassified Shewanella TaxID=196818 RepID=UPI000C8404D1|nr:MULTISPECIES: SapC family protein [unclassified Shewanella]MDO6618321.1 SapC family protein [Shewanella sp. 6_MG-2023]MDO6640734.1 SapC family protein [Shewanella sp. 5_MG-2023]MDO6679274.1 SapC family protein [Shewanella sp. 4_MG-2023]PMG28411.1 multidrug transporter [Shewanella sp. 10N.286.52.C2]PMH89334.1 multidrug transporter [Shewanella sp. 10N.286.48.B5]